MPCKAKNRPIWNVKPWFIACMHAHLSKSFWSTSFMLSWFLCQRISLPKLLILPQRLKRQFVSISRIHNSTPSLSMLMSKWCLWAWVIWILTMNFIDWLKNRKIWSHVQIMSKKTRKFRKMEILLLVESQCPMKFEVLMPRHEAMSRVLKAN